MGTHTIQLDDETQKALASLRKQTGISISEVLKRGLLAYKATAMQKASERPYVVYRRLHLGEGAHTFAEAKHAKAKVTEVIKKKHQR